MKKILFSIACMIGIVLAMTSCNSGDDHYYYYSRLTGVYTSESQTESMTDSSTVILMPNGSKDMIMIQYQIGDTKDSIFITPTINIDEQKGIGEFTEGDWVGSFTFGTNTDNVQTAKLVLQNTKKNLQLTINLTKSHFGHTLAGNWGGKASDGSTTTMSIWLCRPGFADRGYITINGEKHSVLVYGPSNKYGNGTILFLDEGVWYGCRYQLSAIDENPSQSIIIYRNDVQFLEMERAIGDALPTTNATE